MNVGRKAVLGIGALVGLLTLGTTAHAYLSSLTVNKCLSGKVKTEGKGAAAYTGCYSKGASKNVAVDPACLSKSGGKIVSAFGKLDGKPPCETTGDGAGRDADTASFGSDINTLVGDGDAGAGKCDAAKQKLVGKYVAGITGCYAKAAGKGGTVDNASGGCTDKVSVKFQNGVNKAELKPPCTTSGLAALASLQAAANQYIQDQACLLDPTNPGCAAVPTPTPTSTPPPGGCGNGAVDPGEDCDPAGGPATSCQNASNTSAAFTCNPVTCQCACPTKVTFAGDPTSPFSILDTGWTGISHRAPIISNGQTTV
ncbi:MAG: hypothetical protein IT294_16055, partial [Deltaproteobacteria bacterium]|nr:hypothetical protein [Deltaproteobacteria bacterium]